MSKRLSGVLKVKKWKKTVVCLKRQWNPNKRKEGMFGWSSFEIFPLEKAKKSIHNRQVSRELCLIN